MNYFCASQRRDGKWVYTQNGRPCGYCCEYVPIPEDVKWMPLEAVREHNAKMEPLIVNFHSDGHATKEEACACYKKYLLDTRLNLMTAYKKYLLDTRLNLMTAEPANASQQNKCRVCGAWTACYAMVGPYRLFVLCPQHQTREDVETLLGVDESWES